MYISILYTMMLGQSEGSVPRESCARLQASALDDDSLRSALVCSGRRGLESDDVSPFILLEGGGGIPPIAWRRGGLNMALAMDNTNFKTNP